MRRLEISILIVLTLVASAFSFPHRQTRKLAVRSERRVALVIGNSSYDIAPLKNPTNDAQDIARTLRELEFEVIHKGNLTQNQMKREIRSFGEKIQRGDVALFYFAGHGMQVNGQNYLIPIGANINSEGEVEFESVDAGFVLAQMEKAGAQTNIMILDACRNNPFGRSFRYDNRGLALMSASSGTLIAYATAPGSVASDGNERNGIYTQELLKAMRIPDLSIEGMLKQVRIAVRNKTQGRQVPWESSSLISDFFFARVDKRPEISDKHIIPFYFSSLDGDFPYGGIYEGEIKVNSDSVDVTIKKATIILRAYSQYQGRRMLTSINVGLMTYINGQQWDFATKSQKVPINKIMRPGNQEILSGIHFSIPKEDSLTLPNHWIAIELEDFVLDGVNPGGGYQYAHSRRDIFSRPR